MSKLFNQKLTKEDVIKLRKEVNADNVSDYANEYGVTKETIINAVTGKTYAIYNEDATPIELNRKTTEGSLSKDIRKQIRQEFRDLRVKLCEQYGISESYLTLIVKGRR